MKIVSTLICFLWSSLLLGQFGSVIVDENRNRLIDDLDQALEEPDRIYQLNLSGNNFGEIPEVLSQFPRLEYLDLSNNNIKKVDLDRLRQCPNLKTLYLDYNQIDEFPIEIFEELYYLEVLNIGFNNIQKITYDLKSDKLISFNLHHNNLTQISGHWKFRLLYELRLDGNELKNEDIDITLSSRIQSLNLNENLLESPPEFLQKLNKLKSIDLGNNYLDNIEGLSKLRKLELIILDANAFDNAERVLNQVVKFRKLKILSFEKNGISSLPKFPRKSKLEELSLIGNEISELPASDINLPKMKKLWLSGNPIEASQLDRFSTIHKKCVLIY